MIEIIFDQKKRLSTDQTGLRDTQCSGLRPKILDVDTPTVVLQSVKIMEGPML